MVFLKNIHIHFHLYYIKSLKTQPLPGVRKVCTHFYVAFNDVKSRFIQHIMYIKIYLEVSTFWWYNNKQVFKGNFSKKKNQTKWKWWFFWPADLTLLTKCFKNKKANISAIRGARELLFFLNKSQLLRLSYLLCCFMQKCLNSYSRSRSKPIRPKRSARKVTLKNALMYKYARKIT